MSKQVKLKFKKLLKKAEFVQADLEYHDELLPEAKLEFAKVVASILSSLSAEDQQKIDEHKQKAFDEMVERMKKESEVKEKESQEAAALVEAADDIKMNEEELEEPAEENDDPDDKNIKIKKLFYKIADLTHPDKAAGRGVSVAESKRLERIFRKAKEAYSDLNWYVLYCIAIDLDIPVDNPTPQTLDWLESDIRLTMGKISNIANLIVWIWYTGDANLKNMALVNYLQQSFNYAWVPTLDPNETP
tara:strand:- start:1770 stop:2507 length:738 start_codon:yes stop_codon:yes gene_type:complete